MGVNDLDHSQGQYPLALVELMPGVSESVCSEIFEFCDQRVEERGKPVAVLAVESLPLTAMGKIDYVTLEKEYRQFNYKNWTPAK